MTRPPLDRGSIDALQDALATEHAALWSYSLAVAFLPAEQLEQARDDEAAHRALRGSVQRTLAAAGARAVSALPAYAPPRPVVDAASAAELVVVAEGDTLAAWKSVVEHTSDRELRRMAIGVMEDGTLRCARWRGVLGVLPAVPLFPGRR
jgi:Domain of unknown function (DUF4439)